MSPYIYNLNNMDVPEAFKRIDSFLKDNPIDAMDNQLILNVNDITTIKILISDLTALMD